MDRVLGVLNRGSFTAFSESILICGGFVVLVGIVLRLVAARANKAQTNSTKPMRKAS
ncbi:hypothetical protein [Pelagicoccus mobilis]|uniref:Uncharacterized protein n=1 Tax=Pelagicoccus mobilis TaxID=415221 RepID=A0A934S199_9BACT|nr:hypothetical protein [Pelagicoccus mobilis]MBK1877263.1 hypothetical protein [Pelagicoccus mobilis]